MAIVCSRVLPTASMPADASPRNLQGTATGPSTHVSAPRRGLS